MATFLFCLLLALAAVAVVYYVDKKDERWVRRLTEKRSLQVKTVDVPPLSNFDVAKIVGPAAKKRTASKKTTTKKKATKKAK